MHFGAMLDTFAKKGHIEEAEELVSQIEKMGMEITMPSYGSMIDVCAKAGKPLRALHWFKCSVARGF